MPGDVIAGRYRLLEPLGRGAMSSVWKAHDDELDRRVALKTLAPTADRARFEREARAVAAVSHPNIVGLFDYGESEGKPFMVLECLSGGSLEEKLAPGKPLPDDETQRIAADVAAGLAAAHERGLVHRDLKPSNILFDSEGRAKIADFGIARMGDAGTLTEAGTVLGTAAYISPEQAAGLPATAASDVYSFGAMLFRMLTGRLPFVSDNAMELVRMNRDETPPTVASVRPDAPEHLAATADAALAKDPAQRPADGAALLAALRTAVAAVPTMVAPAAAFADDATQILRAPRRRRTGTMLLPAIVLAAVLLLGGAALALALTGGIGGSDNGGTQPGGSLSLPSVPTVPSSTHGSTSTTTPTTTAGQTTTTAPTTSTARTTTARTTTHRTTTTARTTTHRVTTTAPTTTYIPPPPTTTYTPPPTTDTTTTDTTTTAAAVTT